MGPFNLFSRGVVFSSSSSFNVVFRIDDFSSSKSVANDLFEFLKRSKVSRRFVGGPSRSF